MRRTRLLLWMIVFFSIRSVSAQDYSIHGATPDLYLQHTVAPKETWYSIGRTYNLSPKDLAAYNKLTLSSGLDIGQSLRVPLNATNFAQNDQRSADEVLIPLYHTVQEKEWMYRISVNHNKVPIEQLEKWNGISRDDARAGTRLIVGHLRVKRANAPSTAAVVTEPVVTPPVVAAAPRPSGSSASAPVAPAVSPAPAASPSVTPATPPPASQPSAPVPAVAASGGSSRPGGYFRTQYDETGKTTSGVAGVFKSTSGWNDGKYYALMNNVTVGTIIRISFSSTNKSVYAKVLGELPDMKESAGLALRISDAAANELGAGNSKFQVDVRY